MRGCSRVGRGLGGPLSSMLSPPLAVKVDRTARLQSTEPGLATPIIALNASEAAKCGIKPQQRLLVHYDSLWLLCQSSLLSSVASGLCRLQLSLHEVVTGTSLLVYRVTKPSSIAASLTLYYTSTPTDVSTDTSTKLSTNIVAYVHQCLLSVPVYVGHSVNVTLFERHYIFTVSDIESKRSSGTSNVGGSPLPPLYGVDPQTRVIVKYSTKQSNSSSSLNTNNSGEGNAIDFSMIGGLSSELAAIREFVELPLTSPQIFTRFGVRPPRGLLLFGPAGTGKTTIARAIAGQSFASFYALNGPDIYSRYVGESEERLRGIFSEAVKHSPSIIFIDEIDSLCPSRDTVSDPLAHRLVSTLLTLMDGIHSANRLLVIGATNRPDSIDSAMRRPGRFDREIEIGIPSQSQRTDILTKLLSTIPNCVSACEIESVSGLAHGFVGADLKAVVREAATGVVQRIHKQSISSPPSLDSSLQALTINDRNSAGDSDVVANVILTVDDLRTALTRIQPSAMREISLEIPHVRWSDIGGQFDVKSKLIESVDWPLNHPAIFTKLGIAPPKGILLYGPPGCSKTLMAKALATESSRNFIAVKGPELLSKWVGESEKAMREVFRKARAAAPSIVFFDEIDSIASSRNTDTGNNDRVGERVLSQLLQELDGLNELKQVFLLAATNRPDLIDSALMRPGRIDQILYVRPPDRPDEVAILDIELGRVSHGADVSGASIMSVYDKYVTSQQPVAPSQPSYAFAFSPAGTSTNSDARIGFTGAELSSLCREASMNAINENCDAECVELRHFIAAFERVKPRLTPRQIQFYRDYAASSGLATV